MFCFFFCFIGVLRIIMDSEIRSLVETVQREREIPLGSLNVALLMSLGLSKRNARSYMKEVKQNLNSKFISLAEAGSSAGTICNELGISVKTYKRKLKQLLKPNVIKIPKKLFVDSIKQLELPVETRHSAGNIQQYDEHDEYDEYDEYDEQHSGVVNEHQPVISIDRRVINEESFVVPSEDSFWSEDGVQAEPSRISISLPLVEEQWIQQNETTSDESNTNERHSTEDSELQLSCLSQFDSSALQSLLARENVRTSDRKKRRKESQSRAAENISRKSKNLFEFADQAFKTTGTERLKYVLAEHSESKISSDSYRKSENEISKLIDVDSIVAITNEIYVPVIQAKIYPFPNYQHSLTVSNHLTVSLNDDEVKVSSIPNIEIFSFNHHFDVRINIFFPLQREKIQGIYRNIPRRQAVKIFYNRHFLPCLLRAAAHLNDMLLANRIPLSFEIFAESCHSKSGNFVFRAIDASREATSLALHYLRESVYDTEFDKFFFVLTSKGHKKILQLNNAATLPNYLDYWMTLATHQPNSVFIDVALTVFSKLEAHSALLSPEAFDTLLRKSSFTKEVVDINCLQSKWKLI